MAYINRDELDLAIQEIRQFCSSYQSKLNDVINQTVEVSNANASFETFDGCSISGTLKETDEVTSSGVNKKVVDKIIISPSNIDEYCNLISQEKEEMDEKITNIVQSLDSMQSSLEVIAIYLLQVESALDDGTTISLSNRLKSVSQLMEDDQKNGYEFLHSMPILEDGEILFFDVNYDVNDDRCIGYNGKYLKFLNEYGVKVYAPMALFDGRNPIPYADDGIEKYSETYIKYYTDIMKSQERFTELHKESIRNNLDSIVLQDSYVGIKDFLIKGGTTLGITSYDTGKPQITISMHDVLKKPSSDMYYSYVNTYTHETGHVLDNYLGMKKGNGHYSSSDEYQNYYNVLSQNSSSYSALRDYAFENLAENFAESVAEYYGSYGSDRYHQYSPYDLQDIEFDLQQFPWFSPVKMNSLELPDVTAYDVFDSILKNGDMNGIDFSN